MTERGLFGESNEVGDLPQRQAGGRDVAVRRIAPDAHLVMVGNTGDRDYVDWQEQMIKELRLDESSVHIAGHVSHQDMLTYYRCADVYVSMSEHEGFCVPLVEAMCFDVPILAYKAAAVPETMGDSGVLLETKDPATSAMYLHEILFEKDLRSQIIEDERERLKRFSYDVVSKEFIDTLKQYIEGVKS